MTNPDNDATDMPARQLRLVERLNARLRDGMERERETVSRAVHDTIGQTLSAMKMQLHDISRRADIDAAVAARLRELEAHTETLLTEARQIASDLRPGVLDHFGLQAALATTLDRFEQTHGVTARFEDTGDGTRLPRASEVAMLRIVELALDNVVLHARADRVDVRFGPGEGGLELSVRDDGCGFDPDAVMPERALGLLDMRTRANAIGATLRVDSGPGRGTCLRITVPKTTPGDNGATDS